MTTKNSFKERYRTGDTPWDAGQPDFNLIEVVTRKPVPSCKVLDVGCGTGDNSIWLAQNHFQVTGTEISDIALERAEEKALKANVKCDFLLDDFLNNKIKKASFGFIFDRGCFHSFSSEDDRRSFAKNGAKCLEEAGLWLTITGNSDEIRQNPGPPQLTAGDIAFAVEPYFKIISLEASHFGSNQSNPPKAWRCLMQKRNTR